VGANQEGDSNNLDGDSSMATCSRSFGLGVFGLRGDLVWALHWSEEGARWARTSLGGEL